MADLLKAKIRMLLFSSEASGTNTGSLLLASCRSLTEVVFFGLFHRIQGRHMLLVTLNCNVL